MKASKKKKYRLRPWVKVVITFIIGVVIVSSIFSVFGAFAKDKNSKDEDIDIVHGVVKTSNYGVYHVRIIEGYWNTDVTLKSNKEYPVGQIITLYINGNNKITKSEETRGEDLKKLMESYGNDVIKYESEALFEKQPIIIQQ